MPFVKEYESKLGDVMIEHLDGVPWHVAPTRLWCLIGRHRTQTRGWTGYFQEVRRCSCGAISLNGDRFTNIDRGWRRRVLTHRASHDDKPSDKASTDSETAGG